MNINKVLNAQNLDDLKEAGSYLEVKNYLERTLETKLAVNGWSSLFKKIKSLSKIVRSHKDVLLSHCNNKEFTKSKKEISNILNIGVRARSWKELNKKVNLFINIFAPDNFDAYDYYEKVKNKNFKSSSKLEGIEVPYFNKNTSLESVLNKFRA